MARQWSNPLAEVALFATERESVDREAVLDATAAALTSLVAADLVGWNDVDMAEPQVVVLTYPSGSVPDEWAGRELLDTASDHPMVTSYLRNPTNTSPRRMSDLLSQTALHRTRAYQQMLRHIRGEYQATVITTAFGPSGGHAWSFSRSYADFRDRDLERLRAAQPFLAILDRYTASAVDRARPDPRAAALTPRERQVLDSLARGLKADAIGSLLGISGRTVRKHLEHAYAKLGAHDKVTAVLRAHDAERTE